MGLVSRCCCCIDLKTGAIILGTLDLIKFVGILSAGIWIISMDAEELYKLMQGSYNYYRYYSNQESYLQKYQFRKEIFAFTTIGWFIIVSSIMGILINVALLYGSVHKKRLLLVPWLMFYGLAFVINAIVIIIVGLLWTSTKYQIILGNAVTTFVLNSYFWICVKSLYTRLKKEETRNTICMQSSPNSSNI